MESLMGDNDGFLATHTQYINEDTSQLGPLGGGTDDGEMMMTLSRAAESADKAEKRRKKEDKKKERTRKRALEAALTQAAEGEVEIDPALLEVGGEETEDGPPTKKARGPRNKKAKPPPAPGYEEIIGPFPSASGEGPAPQSMLDENGNPLHPEPTKAERKKHAINTEELKTQFTQAGAMLAYLSERWMTTKELKRLEDAGVLTYKKGTFTNTEEKAIRQAVSYLQQSNNLSEDGVVDVLMSKKEKNSAYAGLWSEIASAVPGRPVRFVQKYVKRLYDTRARKGKWTEKEDEELLSAYNATGGSWVKISLTVDRSEEDCRARWRDVLRSRSERDAGRWSKEEEAALLEAVKEANIASSKDELARDPPWEVVTLKMEGKRSQMQCRKKWYVPPLLGVADGRQGKMWPELMGMAIEEAQAGEGGEDPELAAVAPVTPRRGQPGKVMLADKINLVNLLKEQNPATISEIDWDTLAADNFPGISSITLSRAFKKMITKADANVLAPLPGVLDEIQKSLPPPRPYKSPRVVPEDDDE